MAKAICTIKGTTAAKQYKKFTKETKMYLEEIKKEAQSIARRLKKSALPKAAEVFEKCFPVTAETTVKTASKDDTFLITGDIPAMLQNKTPM